MDDGLVACDGAEVRAHGAILSVASGVLRRMLSASMAEGLISETEGEEPHALPTPVKNNSCLVLAGSSTGSALVVPW